MRIHNALLICILIILPSLALAGWQVIKPATPVVHVTHPPAATSTLAPTSDPTKKPAYMTIRQTQSNSDQIYQPMPFQPVNKNKISTASTINTKKSTSTNSNLYDSRLRNTYLLASASNITANNNTNDNNDDDEDEDDDADEVDTTIKTNTINNTNNNHNTHTKVTSVPAYYHSSPRLEATANPTTVTTVTTKPATTFAPVSESARSKYRYPSRYTYLDNIRKFKDQNMIHTTVEDTFVEEMNITKTGKFSVSVSGSVKENVERIMQRYHWKVIWKAPYDYNYDGRITGTSLPNVIEKLFEPFPLQAVMYMSNRTLAVVARNKTT